VNGATRPPISSNRRLTEKRGYYSSFQQCSLVAGLLLGSGIAALLNTLIAPTAMESWGWRIPFLIGGLIGPVGIYMRQKLGESPAYQRSKLAPAREEPGQRSTIRHTAQAFGFMILWAVQFFIFLVYMPTFTQSYAGLSHAVALWSNTAGLLLLMATIPLFGHLSDRIGRKPLLLASCLVFVLLPYPMFRVLLAGPSALTILLIQLLFGLAIAMYSGAGPAAISEIFATRGRTTQMSIANGTAVAIFGGFAPYIATWLIDRTGSPISPTYYVIVAAIVTGAVILGLRESAWEQLR
jgi:Nitrate/nitrite transporter